VQFIYHSKSGKEILKIDGELHKYIFKVRREKKKEFFFRNLVDFNLYRYEAIEINKKESIFKLIDFEEQIVENDINLHIGWCIIDNKDVEKHIHILNELGIKKITFIKCKYSQNYKLNLERLKKILINSSMQCGRSSIIKIDFCDSLAEFKSIYPNSFMLNFSNNKINNFKNEIDTIVVGCEGGFSDDELNLFKNKIVGINSNTILKSESAVIYTASLFI